MAMGNLVNRGCVCNPIIFVIGATGCGKSKIAIEIAKKFNGEVISADSMQVYKGLDITTNKVTKEEQEGVRHHLLDFIDPLNNYTVVDFRNHALPIIAELHGRKQLPVIVGGTNYYMESLIWDFLVSPINKCANAEDTILSSEEDEYISHENAEFNSEIQPNMDSILSSPIIPSTLNHISNYDLHNLLMRIDPERGQSLHPNDRRKVIRSVQVFQKTGKLHSELLKEQHGKKGASSVSGPIRFQNALILWIQCQTQILEKRIDDRVHDMISKGLIEEMSLFHENYNSQRILDNSKADYTRGIFQSIGFKEFHQYLLLNENGKSSDNGKELLNKGVDSMKRVTKHYAKKQNRWIENRFLKKASRKAPPVYSLDSTNIENWHENVKEVSFHIVDAFLKGLNPSQEALPVKKGVENRLETFFCQTCNKKIVGSCIWEIHLKSKSHRKMMCKKGIQTNSFV